MQCTHDTTTHVIASIGTRTNAQMVAKLSVTLFYRTLNINPQSYSPRTANCHPTAQAASVGQAVVQSHARVQIALSTISPNNITPNLVVQKCLKLWHSPFMQCISLWHGPFMWFILSRLTSSEQSEFASSAISIIQHAAHLAPVPLPISFMLHRIAVLLNPPSPPYRTGVNFAQEGL